MFSVKKEKELKPLSMYQIVENVNESSFTKFEKVLIYGLLSIGMGMMVVTMLAGFAFLLMENV